MMRMFSFTDNRRTSRRSRLPLTRDSRDALASEEPLLDGGSLSRDQPRAWH